MVQVSYILGEAFNFQLDMLANKVEMGIGVKNDSSCIQSASCNQDVGIGKGDTLASQFEG